MNRQTKFLSKIEEMHQQLNEEDLPPELEDTLPPEEGEGDLPAEEDPVEEPPASALPGGIEGQDDTVKLQIDYLNMIRKAITMNSKNVDPIDFARLTKEVDANNFDEYKELLTRVVRNNDPHPDFGV